MTVSLNTPSHLLWVNVTLLVSTKTRSFVLCIGEIVTFIHMLLLSDDCIFQCSYNDICTNYCQSELLMDVLYLSVVCFSISAGTLCFSKISLLYDYISLVMYHKF